MSETETADTATQPPPTSTHGAGGLLDYPHYTRPVHFRGQTVPEILTSGDHLKITRWRREQALEKTLRNRPDLLHSASLDDRDRSYLATLSDHDGELASSSG